MTDPSASEPRPGWPHATSPSGRAAGSSAARGAVLIGIAVIIGIVLLQVIDAGSGEPIGDGGGASTETTTTTTTGASSTTSTTTAAKPPAQVSLLVLNGSGRSGAATALTNTLKAKGYPTLTPADAPARTGTVVYFKPGSDRECATVATAVGGSPKVEAIPSPAPTGSENASCVVLLGS
ncbi:MAG: LytR family transcriptional regulator [Actinobacteria bacterium]|nr:LytR family transcriptional regulator [Actinomycetota bacterium]